MDYNLCGSSGLEISQLPDRSNLAATCQTCSALGLTTLEHGHLTVDRADHPKGLPLSTAQREINDPGSRSTGTGHHREVLQSLAPNRTAVTAQSGGD